ncbi:hypothetical protein ACWCOP_10850 [Maricaulaceae bacterium MS644]
MGNTIRTAAMRARLGGEARALRVEGVPMPEVALRVGVPAPTLHQWAAAGRWRACDLAEQAAQAAMAEAEAGGDAGRDAGGHAAGDPDARAEGAAGGAPAAPLPGEAPSDASSPVEAGPLTAEQLRAEADRCARAAMALSRGGRLKEAEAALKLAERYRETANAGTCAGGGAGSSDGSGDGLWEARVSLELEARILAERDGLFERCQSWVRLALEGKITALPGWATTRAFLQGTPYADQYYRCGGVGTGIAGHFGPGPADRLSEEDEAEAEEEEDGDAVDEAGPS